MTAPNWFIGLPFPASLSLPEPPPRVRLYAPEDRHVTLAFFGSIEAEAARRAWQAAAALVTPRVSATLGAVELLGHPRSPSAIAAVLEEGRAPVEALIAAHRNRLLEAAGLPPDHRPGKAHVTLGRIQRKASPIQRRWAAEWSARLSVHATAHLDALALYTWAEDRRLRLFRVVEHRRLDETP